MSARTLVVGAEDRHAESELRREMGARGTIAVLTGDALLAMRLRREGIDAQPTTAFLGRRSQHATALHSTRRVRWSIPRGSLQNVAGSQLDPEASDQVTAPHP